MWILWHITYTILPLKELSKSQEGSLSLVVPLMNIEGKVSTVLGTLPSDGCLSGEVIGYLNALDLITSDVQKMKSCIIISNSIGFLQITYENLVMPFSDVNPLIAVFQGF